MLAIKDLHKIIDNQKILDGINLTANCGEIYGLVGSNGCGKTTLLKHIINIYKADSGEIFFNDHLLGKNKTDLEKFYYVQDNLYFSSNISLNKLYNYEKLFYTNISKEKFNSLINFFNIDANKSLNKMSKGQKKQAAFILAISTNPQVLLLDEIVDGLDAVVKRKFWDVLIREVLENKTTIIVSSHDLKELDNICNKVGIMHEGKIIMEKSLEDIKLSVKRVQFAVDREFILTDECKQKCGIMKEMKIGSINIYTLKGNVEELKDFISKNYKIILFEELQMNLEEVFVTELTEHGYGNEVYKSITTDFEEGK
ncbi:ABC transporter ATP-binding protein [Sedimentibacter sp. zth1]|uniref:ABC transporter ATP-binding protein n=1 Tax=Sedimentibacter sp. zth1 TaxID=2816908 RepID=UPI001A9227C6|nr:ABC transporter ATP-binding protein [Sedimentibacter sp. zth1]QSX05167.1 ABC transporter ATP-binding protein [Sedimentibacter sp. zth1]